jgi:DNA-binding MarR family transcriptional regulator
MPVRQALAFVAVALRASADGTADLRDVANDIKANSAVASRDLLVLGKRGRGDRPGLDLITVQEDYSDLRRRPYVLTKKGQAVVDKLLEAV